MANHSGFIRAVVIAAAFLLTPQVFGQHAHQAESEPQGTPHDAMHGSMIFAGIPHTRETSGSAWQPDATPMHGWHARIGDWSLMAHFNIFAAYDKQWGRRGDDQFNSINWLMLMAQRPLGERADFLLRAMLSLEPATTTARGYPLLFQSGEAFHGEALVDRQHPHDLFMELAARWRFQLAEKTAVSLYFGVPGEPALDRRHSCIAPRRSRIRRRRFRIIGWTRRTHLRRRHARRLCTTVAARRFDLHGREPDEDRWNIDTIHLDSGPRG